MYGKTGSLTVGKEEYIEGLLWEYDIPLEAGCTANECQRANQVQYRSLIGSLMYLAFSTRTNLEQQDSDPHQEHAKQVLIYLWDTTQFYIVLSKQFKKKSVMHFPQQLRRLPT